MKTPDVPSEPTNADLAVAITAGHVCLHTLSEKVDSIAETVTGYQRTVDSVKKWIGAAAVAIIAAIAGNIWQNSHLHTETAAKVETAAATLKQDTAAATASAAADLDAKQADREAQLTANQVKIAASLDELSKRVGAINATARAPR